MKSTMVFFIALCSVAHAWVPLPCVRRAPSIRARGSEKMVLFDQKKERMASYVAEKGLEGNGPMSVVNKIVPSGFRYALYAIFGVSCGAGVAIAGSQGKSSDLVVNGVGLVAVLGAAVLDAKSQASQVTATMSAMDNDQLAKDLYSETNAALIDNVGVTAGDQGSDVAGGGSGAGGQGSGEKRVQTAAELFGNSGDN